MENIVILAALEEEAEALFPGEGACISLAHLHVRKLAVAGKSLAIAVSGVGKVNAALASGLLAQHHKADILLMSGTCGKIAMREEHCFWLAEAVQHDYGAERPGDFVHYSAGAWPIGPALMEPFLALADPGLNLPHARIASGDSFIECPDHARFLSEGLKADLCDMEVAALAQVAERLDIPWGAIKATTDDANGESSQDFQANLLRAARTAAEHMERLIMLL